MRDDDLKDEMNDGGGYDVISDDNLKKECAGFNPDDS